MSQQQIADLVIDISANTTDFEEKDGRVARRLKEQEREQQRSMRRQQNLLDRMAAREAEKLQKQSSQTKQLESEALSAKQRSLQSLQALQREAAQVASSHIQIMSELEKKSSEAFTFKPNLTEMYTTQLNEFEKQKKSLREIEEIRIRLQKDKDRELLTLKEYTALQGRATALSRETESAELSATQAKQRFISKLKEQVTQQSLSRTEMLRLQAAQLGVSSSADIYIRKLEKQNSALKGVTLTSGQYRQAMRQLPMQMTDIVTSLASGMPPWLVAVQQGGQIKDSFGGFGNSLKAITSLITPWKVAMFGGVGALTAFGVAAYQGSKELSEYNKQLVLTGNYAGKTKSQLNDLARALSGDGITQYKMADALAQVVGSGSFSGSQVDMVANVAAKMEKATGQSIDETIKQFQRLKDQPVQAVMELDKSLHFLTATQLEQITTLQEQGRSSEAAKLAMESYANAMDDRTKQIKENLGALERAWVWVGDAAKEAWDKMLDIDREETAEDEIKRLEDYISRFDGSIYTFGMDDRKQRLAELREIKFQNDIKAARDKAERNEEERKKRQFTADQKLKKDYENAEDRHQRRLSEIKNSGASKPIIDESIKREEIRYKKELSRETPRVAKTPKGKAYKPDLGTRNDESAQAELTSLQAQLKLLEQHSAATDFISQQRKNLQLEQAKFDVLEEASKTRKLSFDEQSLLKNKESILASKKQLADLGDKIAKQEHLNKLQDQADKYVKQQEARQKAITDSLGKSTLELQRALEIEQLRSVYGDTPQWDKVQSAKQSTFDKEDAARKDWLAGMETAWGNYKDVALDANAQIQNVTSAALNGFSTQLTNVLFNSEAKFRDFTVSILKMIAEMQIQKFLVGAGGLFDFGGITPNAKGGVYTAPGLSAYSGQVVSKPTLFPFARGAGLMGEAGPEAILPLRRGADGKLGVIAAANKSAGGFSQVNHVTIQNDGSNGEIGPQALNAVYNIAKKGAEDYMRTQRRDGGSFSA
ncbi:phage tail tape measure protein [Providencia manganoxydans]|uniref:phage tail tape measure protein n=1 Tax=Providencia manganoxydans TaxID=2923283 RepID=UPI0032D9DF72